MPLHGGSKQVLVDVFCYKAACGRSTSKLNAPVGAVLPSAFHDKDAEDVKQKQLEEKAEERETFSMGQEDPSQNEPEKFELETMEGMKDASIPKEHATGMEISGSAPSRPSARVKLKSTSVFYDEVDSSFLPSMETQG